MNNAFESIRLDVSELLRLVRASERYCATIAIKPELATDKSHETELERELRIAFLSAKLGV